MALQRRAAELEASGGQLQRPRTIRALRAALRHPVPTAAGWLCLAQLHLTEGNAAEALDAAKSGLQYVNGRERLSKEKFCQVWTHDPLCCCDCMRVVAAFA